MQAHASTCFGFLSPVSLNSSIVWFGRATFSTPSPFGVISVIILHLHCIIVRVLIFHLFLATKFLLGAGVGIVASGLCISRRLYSIASIQAVSTSHVDVSA